MFLKWLNINSAVIKCRKQSYLNKNKQSALNSVDNSNVNWGGV